MDQKNKLDLKEEIKHAVSKIIAKAVNSGMPLRDYENAPRQHRYLNHRFCRQNN